MRLQGTDSGCTDLRCEVDDARVGPRRFVLREGFRESGGGAVGVFATLHDVGPAFEEGGGPRLAVAVLANALVERDFRGADWATGDSDVPLVDLPAVAAPFCSASSKVLCDCWSSPGSPPLT